MIVDKKRIRTCFARAAATYDRQAVIQRRVADRLLALLAEHQVSCPTRVLEIGTCTGILTTRLVRRFPGITELYLNDLVPDFKTMVLRGPAADLDPIFLEGDVESLNLPDRLDLVISSSTFHWLEDLDGLLGRLAEKMAPGAHLCFSLYGPQNFQELRELTGRGLRYHNLAELTAMAGRHLSPISCEEETVLLHFDDPRDLLRHLRETGVNALKASSWNRTRLNEFLRAYQKRFRGERGVRLTYHPVYCLARKNR